MSRIGTDSQPVSTLSFLRNWVTARLGNIRHERRVAQIAGRLAVMTRRHHTLTAVQLRLMKMAAIVHDVGRCIDDENHPEIGAEMILETGTLPLKRRERRALAYLTMYHRGEVPEIGEDSILHDGDDHEGLYTILAFLRAADCLDSRSLPSPEIRIGMRGDRVRIHCRTSVDGEKARRVFTRRKKFRLLEQVLGCRVEVNVDEQRRLRMVA